MAISKILDSPLLVLDTETTGLRFWQGVRAYLYAFCTPEGHTLRIELPVDPQTRQPTLDKHSASLLAEVLCDAGRTIVMHNAKFDMRAIEFSLGYPIAGRIECSMTLLHCLDTGALKGLKPLANIQLNWPRTDETDLRKATYKARRIAKRLGWVSGDTQHLSPGKQTRRKSNVPADYWMVTEIARRHPELLTESERQTWPDLVWTYAKADVETTMLLWLKARRALQTPKHAACKATYAQERKLLPVVYAMETRGVRLDATRCESEIASLERRIAKYRKDVLKWVPAKEQAKFNPNSDRHLSRLLGDQLGLLNRTRHDDGTFPTDTEALDAVASKHVAVQAVLRYRAAAKGCGFFYGYLDRAVADTTSVVSNAGVGGSDNGNGGGSVASNAKAVCLHPDFDASGPRTLRFSCKEPNLQNVPNPETTRGFESVRARAPFGPRPRYVWLACDYEQLELRIFADVANEPFMLDAFRRGRDLHEECAQKAWGGVGNPAATQAVYHALEFDRLQGEHSPEVYAAWRWLGMPRQLRGAYTDKAYLEGLAKLWLKQHSGSITAAEGALGKKNTRTQAKGVMFAMIFGGGARAIVGSLHCSPEEATKFLAEYDTAFPRITEFIRQQTDLGRRQGYIVNCLGHRINVDRRKPYKAVNYVVQGSAASFIKLVMLRLAKYFQAQKVPAWLVMTIHDEVVIEVKRSVVTDRLLRNIKRIMEDRRGIFEVATPVKISRIDTCWDEAEPYDLR